MNTGRINIYIQYTYYTTYGKVGFKLAFEPFISVSRRRGRWFVIGSRPRRSFGRGRKKYAADDLKMGLFYLLPLPFTISFDVARKKKSGQKCEVKLGRRRRGKRRGVREE